MCELPARRDETYKHTAEKKEQDMKQYSTIQNQIYYFKLKGDNSVLPWIVHYSTQFY